MAVSSGGVVATVHANPSGIIAGEFVESHVKATSFGVNVTFTSCKNGEKTLGLAYIQNQKNKSQIIFS